MNKALFIGLLTASLTVGAGAYAQAPRAQPSATPTPSSGGLAIQTSSGTVTTISTEQLLAIGAGAVIGAVLLDVVLPARVAYLFGGLAGAYLGNVWYTQHSQ